MDVEVRSDPERCGEPALSLEINPRSLFAGERFELRIVVRDVELLELLDAGLNLDVPASICVGDGCDPVIPMTELCRWDGEARLDCRISADAAEGPVALAADLRAPGGSILASARIDLILRTKASFEDPLTCATLIPVEDEEGVYRAVVRLHNAGPSTARDVVVAVPIPAGTFSEATGEEGTALRRFASLEPGRMVETSVRVRIARAIDQDFLTLGSVSVGCSNGRPLTLPATSCAVCSGAEFDGELTCDAADDGALRLRLRATNSSGTALRNLTVRWTLPEPLRYAAGSGRIDGLVLQSPPRPVMRRGRRANDGKRKDDERIPDGCVPRLRPGETIDAEVVAYALPPFGGEIALVHASLELNGRAVRTFDLPLALRAAAAFPPGRNVLEFVGAQERETDEVVAFTLRLENCGTAGVEAIRVAFDGDAFDDAKLLDGCEGAFEAGEVRIARGQARISRVGAGGQKGRLAGRIYCGEREVGSLEPGELLVRSVPSIRALRCSLSFEDDDVVLRPGRAAVVSVVVANEGSAGARSVRAVFDLPESVALDVAEGLQLGDIPAGGVAAGDARLTLTRPLRGWLGLRGALHAREAPPTPLETIWLQTSCEPDFATSNVAASSHDAAVGEAVSLELRIRNSGDGIAERLVVRVDPLPATAYVHGSTRVNGRHIVDRDSCGALFGRDGLTLVDVSPGAEIAVEWIVHACAPEPWVPSFVRLGWDAGRTASVEIDALFVHEPEEAAVEMPAPQEERPAGLCVGQVSPASILAFMDAVAGPDLICDVLAMRALLADGYAGAPHPVALRLQAARDALRPVLDRLCIKVQLPGYEITGGDLETRASRSALSEALGAIGSEGARGLDAMRGEPLGSPRALEATAMLLACDVGGYPELAEHVRAYKAELSRALAELSTERDALARRLREPTPRGVEETRLRFLLALRELV